MDNEGSLFNYNNFTFKPNSFLNTESATKYNRVIVKNSKEEITRLNNFDTSNDENFIKEMIL